MRTSGARASESCKRAAGRREGEERRPLFSAPSPKRRGGAEGDKRGASSRLCCGQLWLSLSRSPPRGGGWGEGLLTRSSGLVEAGHDRRDVVLAAPFVRGGDEPPARPFRVSIILQDGGDLLVGNHPAQAVGTKQDDVAG